QTTVFASAAGAGNSSTPVDAGGNYRMEGAPTGTVRVVARVGGGFGGGAKSSEPKSVVLDPGSSATADIEFKSNTVVRGRVPRAASGQRLDKARVEVRPKGSDTMLGSSAQMSGPDGSFTIDDVSRGPYQISADKEGFGNAVKDLVVDETPSDVELKLSPSAGITLRVVDARDGRLIAPW